MTDTSRNTFNRPDTLFGICEAVGQDFGINPLWVRLSFVPAIFFAPVASLLVYIGLGFVVLASRLLFPARHTEHAAPAAPEAAPLVADAPAGRHAHNDEQLPLAA